MSYQALYRKWRPGEFEEVKGQEHIVKTLKNQIMAERIGHAYLFCGTRGTGKTTVAKLFAKAVNCEHPVDGSPCNCCASCKAINAQTSMNVIEIDAASNNGVENIREIRENVQYSPTQGKYKVYIIDEVHMLSIGAFNALLKTLEEPPAYVIFILATTEAHKIPVTILSRCQRYDFKRISIDTIAQRLTDLMKREQIEVEDRAIYYIAKAADGSMRDALSLLDQCISFYLGETLTYDHVLEVLGAVDLEVLSTLFHRIVENDVDGLLHHIERLVMDGREMTQLVSDFTWYLRNLLFVQESPDLKEVLEVSDEQLENLKKDAALCSSDTLMRFIRITSELSNRLRYSTQKRIEVEVAFVKLCRPQMEQDSDSLLERLRQLEDTVAKLQKEGIAMPAKECPRQDRIEDLQEKKPSVEEISRHLQENLKPAELEDLKQLVGKMDQVKTYVGKRNLILYSALKNCRVILGNGEQRIRFAYEVQDKIVEYKVLAEEAKKPDNLLQEALNHVCGKEVPFDVLMLPPDKKHEIAYLDIKDLVSMPIEQK